MAETETRPDVSTLDLARVALDRIASSTPRPGWTDEQEVEWAREVARAALEAIRKSETPSSPTRPGVGPSEPVELDLSSVDGNAFSIIGAVRKALRRAGADTTFVDAVAAEMTSGGYDHLLSVAIEFDGGSVDEQYRIEADLDAGEE